MIRVMLAGRSPRVLRPEELAASVWELQQRAPEDAPHGPFDLEWLSPAGLVLEHRACASLGELAAMIPSLLGH